MTFHHQDDGGVNIDKSAAWNVCHPQASTAVLSVDQCMTCINPPAPHALEYFEGLSF